MSKIIKRSKQLALAILSTTSLYAPQIIALPYNYYQATRIENLGYIHIVDINNNGTVAVATHGHDGFIYKKGLLTQINKADEWIDTIYINDNDQVAGTYSRGSYSNYNGFFYDDGYLQDINKIFPIKINNNGQIIGRQGYQIVSYLNGTASTLALPDYITAVNSANNAAGIENGKPFTYINGTKQIINIPAGVQYMFIEAINDDNKVIGNVNRYEDTVPFLIENDTFTTLGRLENREGTYATDINANGTIVGYSYNTDRYCDTQLDPLCDQSRNHAAFMIEDGIMTNLTGRLLKQDAERGVKITSAYAINDFNFIVADGYEIGKDRALYLLTPTPVPLPASIWMFLSGLSIIGALRRLACKV